MLFRSQELAVELVSSLKQHDELVVAALSNQPGSSLVTNLANVGIVATKVGIGLGYYGQELERLALGGLVHDIGLFAVPPELIAKTGRLTPDERRLIERHPELGSAAILRSGDDYQWLSLLVRHAHERLNGHGYPSRLRGREISEMAQIIGVADVFDALISARPYRQRLLPHEAVAELMIAERATFPRELLKALVEQLSVYPLGTSVRLSTGETGTVVGVNARYPLRPIVRVEELQWAGGFTSRQINLSLTPLVTVVEVLDPPAVERMRFEAGRSGATGSPATQSASDQVTEMLEGLDAIAEAIQGVVETRAGAAPHAGVGEDRHRDEPAGQRQPDLQNDPAFQKEIVGLFALEAREWLGQVQSALRRLSGQVDGPVRAKLYGVILNGIGNLARSAATVQLPEIETMASELLPLLRHVGTAGSEVKSETVQPLRMGIEQLAAEVQRLDVRDSLPMPDSDAIEAGSSMQDAAPVSGPAPARPLLAALHELQRVRARSVQPARDVLEAIIQRAEQEADQQPTAIDAAVIGRILGDLDRMDDEFLREIHDRVPAVIDQLSKLKGEGRIDFVTASQLDPIFVHLESLHDLAGAVHATAIMMFLQGIKTFLSATAYRKLAALPDRLEAVDARMQTLVPMAEQWVRLGRLERAAIEAILPS